VVDDQGANVTSGFTQDFIPPTKAIFKRTAILSVSGGPNYRTNIGIRSVGGSSIVLLQFSDRDGQLLQGVLRSLEADMFEQVPFAALFPKHTATAGYLRIHLMKGSPVIVYASTTDNRTNDSSIQFAKQFGE
jgi:hypothetical protein